MKSSALQRAAASDRVLTAFGGDLARAARFSASELGPIEELGMRGECLLSTLEAYLEHGQRVANASAVLGRHRGTVYRHLGEVERLLDCRIEERSAELLWALRLRRALSDSGDLT